MRSRGRCEYSQLFECIIIVVARHASKSEFARHTSYNIILHHNTASVTMRNYVMKVNSKEFSVNYILSELQTYMHDLLAITVTPSPWGASNKMPFFLTDQYSFFQAKVLSSHCLFMVANNKEGLTPSTICKQWKAVSEYWSKGDVIYIADHCSAHNRKRLIEYKVPFIIPGNQMYLPTFGFDFREHFKHLHLQRQEQLSSASQLLTIMAIQHEDMDGLSSSELANMLGYSAMSMTRSARELESLDLVKINKVGRRLQILFKHHGKKLWFAARDKMVNPARKKIWIKSVPDHWPGLWAGESALAKQSMISEPKYPVYAIASSKWSHIRENMGIKELAHPEPGCAALELWRYDPERLAEQGCVDCFSLWLSLQGSMDERIEMALEEMMEAT